MRHVLPPNPVRRLYDPRTARQRKKQPERTQVIRREALFKNYYDVKKKPPIPTSLRWSLIIVAIILIIQSCFNLPYFRITNIEIAGLKYITSDEMRSFIDAELGRRRFIIFKNDNYFLIALDRLQRTVEHEYLVEVKQIEKRFPRGLMITVQERIAGFVLQTPSQYIQIDNTGEWIGEVPGPTGNQNVIADERSEVGTSIPLAYLEQATQVVELWGSLVPTLKLLKFHMGDDNTRIEVSTDRGFRVYLNPQKDISPQLKRLAIFIQDAEVPDPGEYIDLRFDESLYLR